MKFNYNRRLNKLFLNLSLNTIIIDNTIIKLPISSNNIYEDKIIYALSNQNNILIVIEEMCLGFFLEDYFINKLPYIVTHRKYSDGISFKSKTTYINKYNFKVIESANSKSGSKLYLINKKWDIFNWNFNKLLKINYWISYIDDYNKIKDNFYIIGLGSCNEYIDFEFLKAMGCEIDKNLLEIDNDI